MVASKIDESFQPSMKSEKPPSALLVRNVDPMDLQSLVNMLKIRNPDMSLADLEFKINKDIDLSLNQSGHLFLVSEVDSRIVGFCRARHSSTVDLSRKRFQSPEAWYGTGILVDPFFRRRNVARRMTEERLRILKTKGVTEFYSVVDEINQASVRVHLTLGYKEIDRAQGFLHQDFSPSQGILSKLEWEID